MTEAPCYLLVREEKRWRCGWLGASYSSLPCTDADELNARPSFYLEVLLRPGYLRITNAAYEVAMQGSSFTRHAHPDWALFEKLSGRFPVRETLPGGGVVDQPRSLGATQPMLPYSTGTGYNVRTYTDACIRIPFLPSHEAFPATSRAHFGAYAELAPGYGAAVSQ